MPHKSPSDPTIFQMVHANLASEGAIRLIKHVLRRDGDLVVQMLAGQQKVQRGWGDDDFGVRVELGSVEVADDVFDGLDRAVPGGEKRDQCHHFISVERTNGGPGRKCWGCVDGLQTYILKFPPPKNLRAILATVDEERSEGPDVAIGVGNQVGVRV